VLRPRPWSRRARPSLAGSSLAAFMKHFPTLVRRSRRRKTDGGVPPRRNRTDRQTDGATGERRKKVEKAKRRNIRLLHHGKDRKGKSSRPNQQVACQLIASCRPRSNDPITAPRIRFAALPGGRLWIPCSAGRVPRAARPN